MGKQILSFFYKKNFVSDLHLVAKAVLEADKLYTNTNIEISKQTGSQVSSYSDYSRSMQPNQFAPVSIHSSPLSEQQQTSHLNVLLDFPRGRRRRERRRSLLCNCRSTDSEAIAKKKKKSINLLDYL
jgi:hypothetical protein